ncbi:MAG: YlmH/Sll1252 family protein, partial [Clostridia bacterium]|nr:YlmH/Sll1252 family protein [Clostridia bacterium]
KQDVIAHGRTEEEKLMLAKAFDAYTFSGKRNMPYFTGFLSPADRALAEIAFKTADMSFYGGFPEAERSVLGFAAEGEDGFPVCIIKSEGDFSSLSHRDFLGSLMALGITRDNIGDIVKKDECCYIFVLRKMADYIKENFIQVKRSNVKNEILECGAVTVEKEFEVIKKSVASLRADAVIAASFNLSRSDAAEAVKRGLVTVNYRIMESTDKKLSEGDTLSLRGKGKAVLKRLGDFSKKGRLFIEIKKYK